MRKSLWIVPLLLLSAAIGSTTARADTFDYTISGADTASIAITETGGVIGAISGTFDGATINALLAPGTYVGNDNAYNPGTLVDIDGVSFTLLAPDTYGATYINLYLIGQLNTSQGASITTDPVQTSGDTFALSPSVPELNPTTGSSAFVLLACAALILRGRRPLPTP